MGFANHWAKWKKPGVWNKGTRRCRVCHARRGLIRKYKLFMCRRCFREKARDIGFVKVKFNIKYFKCDLS